MIIINPVHMYLLTLILSLDLCFNSALTFWYKNSIIESKSLDNLNLNSMTMFFTVFILLLANSSWVYLLLLVACTYILNLTKTVYTKNIMNSYLVLMTLIILNQIYFTEQTMLVFVVLIEIINIIVVCCILINLKTKLLYNKSTYLVIVTTNILVLSSLLVGLVMVLTTIKCTDILVVQFVLTYTSNTNLALFIYLILLLKLGLFLGPKYNIHLYLKLHPTVLMYYMYYYYIVFVYIILLITPLIQTNSIILSSIVLIIFLLNKQYLSGIQQPNLIFYWSNQISLIYLQLLLL